jgi:small GTP-binding protein
LRTCRRRISWYVLVVLNPKIGKSCISQQYIRSEFEEEYTPTIEERYPKEITSGGKKINLEIIDTAGADDW